MTLGSPLDDAALRRVLRTLRDAGMVIIPDVYDAARIATLGACYGELLATEQEAARSRRVQPTDGAQHVQMQLPLVPPFSDVDVVAHPVVVQVLSAVLGDGFHCSYYNSNTAFPGSTHQRVHRDAGPVFGGELQVPTPTTALVLNIPLCDFTEENGSTQVWPGSHLILDASAEERDDLTARSEALASTRLDIPAGALALRDLRLWHRGMPNRSTASRSMLAIVYQRGWLSWRAPSLRIPATTWESWPEHVRTMFAAAPVDHPVEPAEPARSAGRAPSVDPAQTADAEPHPVI